VFIVNENSKNLVGYCGLYCGACGIYQGRIKQAVENLWKVIRIYGFDKIAPELAKWEPAFQHYKEFAEVMDGWVKIFGECPGCVKDGGDPECGVRECCKQKGYALCVECGEMDGCATLQRYPWAADTLRQIKDMGADKWLSEMQKKVDAGYCSLDEALKQA